MTTKQVLGFILGYFIGQALVMAAIPFYYWITH